MSCEYDDISHSEFLHEQTKVEDGIHRNPMMKKNQPISCLDLKYQTVNDVFMKGHSISKDDPCIGWRPSPDSEYKWLTYDEVLTKTKQFGSGLISKGAQTNPDQFIGIFSQNRVEWKITEQTCNSYSMCIVPLYDTLGAEAIDHIVNLCELKIIVVDTEEKAQTLLKCVEEKVFTITTIVIMNEPSDEVKQKATDNNVEMLTFDEVLELGKENLKDFVPPKPDDLHTICFTSGTTGLPKGVMLTHKNIVANLCGIYGIGKDSFLKVGKEDVHFSYLPLAHVMERLVSCFAYYNGARVGFFQGDIKLLLSDIEALKPSIFPMVPRLINRLFDKITKGANAVCIKRLLFGFAEKSKLKLLRNGKTTRGSFWDKIVYKKLQNMFGGRVRVCLTGAAPISPDVLNFMRCMLGVPFSEGYGQTEATAGISISLPGDFFSGSVGTPAICNEVKLVDVPEKNYFASEGKGEICARGNNIFKGYYKNEEKTKEALDEDGWLHTGDIGMWLPNGSLKVIDRKKHIFKLSQGEYIAPEKIEQVLVQSPAVAQIYVHGDSLKSCLVGVVVPDEESFGAWVQSKGGAGEKKSFKDLCESDRVNEMVLDDMKSVGSQKGLKGFEIPKKIYLCSELFSVENNLLTPTFKSKRPVIGKKFADKIEEMYQNLD